MARIEATTHIEAPPERVFAVLVDWETQPAWMRGVSDVTVLSDHRSGQGVRLRCRTDLVGGLAVDDDLVTTDWQQDRLVAVRHTARLIRGVGAFELAPTPHGTRLVWWEEVDLPLWAVGEAVGTLVVVPLMVRRFRASLAGLKRICESQSVRP